MKKWTEAEEKYLLDLCEHYKVKDIREDFPFLQAEDKLNRSYASIVTKLERMEAKPKLDKRLLDRCIEYVMEELSYAEIHEKLSTVAEISLKDMTKLIEEELLVRRQELGEWMEANGIRGRTSVYKLRQWLKLREGTPFQKTALRRILSGR